MIDFARELNAEQLRVVQEGDDPCLVLAGAGSGKTRTITYRVAYLLEKGVKPENILLVTFTNKAAGEMKERIKKLEIGNWKLEIAPQGGVDLPWSGTFHHIAYRILRIYAPLLGYKNNFTVLDSDDSESLVKLCIKDVKTDSDGKRFPSARTVQSIISYARNAEKSIDEVIENKYYQFTQFSNQIKIIADLYSKKKKEANAMDFDDLLVNLSVLLNQEKVRQKYATQFQYILVDEYQDTNKIQASIIKKFAIVHNNVLVVGDDAQSIYSFRAADIQNILQFERNYPGAKIFKLEINYRSTEQILNVANSVIAKNVEQYKKNLRVADSPSFQEGVGGVAGASALGSPSVRQAPPLPSLHPQIDQQSEAEFIAKKIEEHIASGIDPKEIAVLFRASHHSQMLEVELVQRGIQYDYRGGVRFFERAHIKDVLAYLRIMNNIADTTAWLRILMHEEGIGPAAAARIAETMKAVEEIVDVGKVGDSVLGGKAQTGWQNFIRIWDHLLGVPTRTPAALAESLIVSPYREYLEAEYIDSRDRLNDIKQLIKFAERYDNLEEFLADASLQESFRSVENQNSKFEIQNSRIVLSTIHQAKGLEWGAVFIINLSAGAFPNDRAAQEENGIEEERRLFYVAITRAKHYLYLTYPMAGGSFGDFLSGPSMFLSEIDNEFLDDHSLLSMNSTVLNGSSEEVEYVDEYASRPKKIKPGSFLIDVNDF